MKNDDLDPQLVNLHCVKKYGSRADTFYDHNAKMDVFQLFQTSNCTAYAEFGCSAVSELDVLKKIIPEDELFPIRDAGS